MAGSIYVIRNFINDKVYIGQTVNNIDKRFKKHLSQTRCRNRCSALYDAFAKYGKHNFYIELIEEGEFDTIELNRLECLYIQLFNCVSPSGYNLTNGGKSGRMSQQSKNKISNTMQGRKITWGEAISKTMTEKWGNNEYRAEMTKKHTGKRGYKYKKHSKPLRANISINKINLLKTAGYTVNAIAKIMGVSFSVIKIRLSL